MLEVIGVDRIDALFADVPEQGKYPDLALPAPLPELDLKRHMRAQAEQNLHTGNRLCFLGAGAYQHFIPATVDEVLRRNEFYTAYTPYQAEASQGMLQAMFEYQSMVCRLTGMDVANASHYDGSTALAEAVRMALNAAGRDRNKVVVASALNPRYREVVQSYLQGTDSLLIDEQISDRESGDERNSLIALVDGETAAVVIQNPNFFGQFESVSGLADAVHAAGALLIVVADPIALGRFQPPGAYGADVVVADGQPLGIPLSFGGPYLGIFAARREHVHHLPGRLVGETIDVDGRRGYVLTLAAREQHVRRARATSNICTNAGLMALAAATYMATLGERGMREITELCYHKSHYAAQQIARLQNLHINPQAPREPFFKEFVVSLPKPVTEVNRILLDEFEILGGYDLVQLNPKFEGHMLIAVTEMHTKSDIDQLVEGLRQATA